MISGSSDCCEGKSNKLHGYRVMEWSGEASLRKCCLSRDLKDGRKEPRGVLRKYSTHSEEPRNPQLPRRALEGMVFLLAAASPGLLLLLIFLTLHSLLSTQI